MSWDNISCCSLVCILSGLFLSSVSDTCSVNDEKCWKYICDETHIYIKFSLSELLFGCTSFTPCCTNLKCFSVCSSDPCRHQERFFSDGTPPPVPRKRRTRTLSLPGTNALSLPPLSPLSPLPGCPQNFDNPVYMMAQMSDTYIQEETEDLQASSGTAVPSPSFSQLTFDTPDEHLSSLFRNFVDERIVSEGVQHRHLLFLRRVVQSVEEQSLLRVPKRDFSSLQPQDFLLREGSKSMLIGDKTFYSLHSPKFPERELGLRVNISTGR